MSQRVLFPNAIDYFRVVHHNLVSNAKRSRHGYVLLPSLYTRAYILTHETGELRLTESVPAPDETV
jgi:hypothetical protein